VSKYPSSDFDLAFAVPQTVPAGTLLKSLRQAGGNLLVDAVLIDRMKEHAAARELSMSLLVEQFFAQQLSHKESLEASIELSGEDRFISKFGGIASDFGAMSDAEIKELVFLERLKKHS
jgi:hypothetical protein